MKAGEAAILIGQRIRRYRLNRNLAAESLAQKCGVTRMTLHRLESGGSVSLKSFLSILAGLGLLDRVSEFLPEPPISPIEIARLRGKERQRATGTRLTRRSGAKSSWTW